MNANIEDILNLYQAGMSQKEISEKLKISQNTTRLILKENDVETMNYRHIKPFVNEAVIFLLNQGFSQKEISNICDISIFVVRDIVKKNNLNGISKKSRKQQRSQLIIDMYLNGVSKREIGRTLHADLRSINAVLTEAGLYQRKEDIEIAIINLSKYDFTLKEISTITGVSPKRIKRIIEKRGASND